MMKIAHVSVGSIPVLHRFGGAVQRRVMGLAEDQAGRGHEVVVYSVGDDDGRREHNGVDVRYLACRRGSRVGWIQLQMRAIAAMKRERVDVVHFHNQPEGAVLGRGLRAAKFLSFDYFLFHGGRRSPLYPVYRRFLRAFDGLLPVSGYCRDEASAYWRLDPDRMSVVYNGVDVRQFRPDEALREGERKTLGIDGRVLLYVGRVCRQKGTDLLLDAYRLLKRRHGDLRLVIAGPIGQFGWTDGDGDGGWPARIAEAGGTYLGPVAEERLAGLYNLADVFVMPTRELEMFGMAAVEAQACGRPVVASDHGGLKETVPSACGGRFGTGESADLARTLDTLLDDADRHRLASSRARAHAESFSWGRINEQLGAIYTQATRRAS